MAAPVPSADMSRVAGHPMYQVSSSTNCCGAFVGKPTLTIVDPRDGAKHEYYFGCCASEWYKNGERAGNVAVQSRTIYATNLNGERLGQVTAAAGCCSKTFFLASEGTEYRADIGICSTSRAFSSAQKGVGLVRQIGLCSTSVYISDDFPFHSVAIEELIDNNSVVCRCN